MQDYLLLTAGIYLMSLAVVSFWRPHHLVTGGVSGLAIIIEDVTYRMSFVIPLWVSNIVLNIPLFLLGYKTMGQTFLVRSIYGMLIFSLAMHNISFLPPIPSDVLLGSVFGGIFCGVGVGLIVKAQASTGGTVLAASVLHNRLLRHVSVGNLLFACDFAVVLMGLAMFGPESAMYAVVGIFVTTRVADAVAEGFNHAKAAYIISDQSEAIADAIMREIKRGATEISARGMYTKEAKGMLMCVVSGRELVQLKQVVYGVDPKAFIIVSDVREVLGEGFTAHSL